MDLFLEAWVLEASILVIPGLPAFFLTMSWNSVTIEMYLSQLMRLCPESVRKSGSVLGEVQDPRARLVGTESWTPCGIGTALFFQLCVCLQS